MHGQRQMSTLIRKYLDGFRKSQVTTICELTLGLVAGGRLGLAAIARAMPRTTTVRYRIKRLWRFAQNPRISVEAASDSLIRWLFGSAGGARTVIGLDWTDLGDYWMLGIGGHHTNFWTGGGWGDSIGSWHDWHEW